MVSLAEGAAPVAEEAGEAVEAALQRIDSRLQVSDRAREAAEKGLDALSGANQKLVNSPAFALACITAYQNVVVQGESGISLLGAELAVWMIYGQLNATLPVYLEPPPREEITAMYRVVDDDNNRLLSEAEFLHFGQLLFSDDTKPHAVSLVKVGRELTVQLVLLPAACEMVSRYTQVLPIVCHIPTVFFAPAITAAVGAVRTAP